MVRQSISAIRANPATHCPDDILAQQVALTVRYIDFTDTVQQGIIEIHQAVADDVQAFFTLALQLRFPIERVARASEFNWDDPRMMAENITSGFNYRTIPNTDIVSHHSYGRAFDVNTRLNPYIVRQPDGTEIGYPKGAVWDISKPGTLYSAHPLVQLMKSRGWLWGGEELELTDNTDYQHFEKPESYEK